MPPRGKHSTPGNQVVAPRKHQKHAAKTSADHMATDEVTQEPSSVEWTLLVKKLTSNPPAQNLPTTGGSTGGPATMPRVTTSPTSGGSHCTSDAPLMPSGD
ncbi:hypothetical protein JB92DRAFT_3104663 [Gautieria morchelliformis]|nr:hypothetical protein JB92DRAFT_3104663 [Gautieria morchelliformis]